MLSSGASSTNYLLFLLWPLLTILVVSIIAFSLIGLVGEYYDMPLLVYLYRGAYFVIIVGMASVIVVANNSTRCSGDFSEPMHSDEFYYKDDSIELIHQVCNHWPNISNSIRNSNVCSNRMLSSIQSGCCMPPATCNFNEYPRDKDCHLWSNDRSRLCYKCSSCKIGVVINLRKSWWMVFLLNVVLHFLILALYIGEAGVRLE